MLPTPDTSHVSFKNVYEPAEDSFLLIDTLSSSQETTFLKQRINLRSEAAMKTSTPLVLEIGSGSGVVLAFVASHAEFIFGRPDILLLATDLNEYACHATSETVKKNMSLTQNQNAGTAVPGSVSTAVFLGSLNASLATCIRPNMVDVLLFNPPYVPSEDVPEVPLDSPSSLLGLSISIPVKTLAKLSQEQTDYRFLAIATDGGPPDGMSVTISLLNQLPLILNEETGVAYVLLCARNKPLKVREDLLKRLGERWKCEIVGESGGKGGWERLSILRIWRDAQS